MLNQASAYDKIQTRETVDLRGTIMMIYLVRHGKDDDTVRGGWSDHGLSPIGIKQVQALAEEMAAAKRKYCRIAWGAQLNISLNCAR